MPDLAQSTFILPQDATLTSEQSALEQRIWTFINPQFSSQVQR
ncbi:MAG: hypothetical protein ABF503_10745 [Lacticaseibacillus paracasei]